MALVKCIECGKEVSNKADICPNCRCPIEKVSILSRAREVLLRNKKIAISISSALAIILILCVLYNVLNQNVFSPYLKFLGKPYKEIPEDYTIKSFMEGFKVAKKNTENIFGIPGEIELLMFYDEEKGDYEKRKINMISWNSTKEDDLTEEEIEQFKSGVKKIYGKWDEENFKESEYPISSGTTNYFWKREKGYGVFLSVNEDKSGLVITWYLKTKHVDVNEE